MMNNYTVRKPTTINLKRLDWAGILCSGACALHCLLTPVAAFMLPSATSFFENEWFHIFMILLIIPIAVVSFVKQRRSHGDWSPLRYATLGILSLFAPFLFDYLFHIHDHQLEIALTVIGSSLLVYGHLQNIKLTRLHSRE